MVSVEASMTHTHTRAQVSSGDCGLAAEMDVLRVTRAVAMTP